ncbi:hypothetical protein SERLA73DRAFT_50899, partial [Serpula lacrymans var. lacrymans S7.3]
VSTVLQILLYLPLTLATLSTPAFLLLSLLLSTHSLIHGSLLLLFNSPALSVLQVPMHPFLLLLSFNAFAQALPHKALPTLTASWGSILSVAGPLFITMEGLSSLLAAQKLGQKGTQLADEREGYQFALLIASAAAYVVAAWWIADRVQAYPLTASTPLASTFLGVALTAFIFLSLIGFALRRTNIIESSVLALFLAYNVWLAGFHRVSFPDTASSYAPLLSNILPHLQTLLNFITNTLPKPVLIALLYRLAVLHFASRILPTIGADSWALESEGDEGGWADARPVSTSILTRVLLTYRQLIFVMVYSHLLLLDPSSQIWWRWMNIFFTLVLWSVELLVGGEGDEMGKWKVE